MAQQQQQQQQMMQQQMMQQPQQQRMVGMTDEIALGDLDLGRVSEEGFGRGSLGMDLDELVDVDFGLGEISKNDWELDNEEAGGISF